VKLDDLTLFHIHRHNLDWLGFCFATFDLDVCPAAANDDQ
jgi:hypothetical protein